VFFTMQFCKPILNDLANRKPQSSNQFPMDKTKYKVKPEFIQTASTFLTTL